MESKQTKISIGKRYTHAVEERQRNSGLYCLYMLILSGTTDSLMRELDVQMQKPCDLDKWEYKSNNGMKDEAGYSLKLQGPDESKHQSLPISKTYCPYLW